MPTFLQAEIVLLNLLWNNLVCYWEVDTIKKVCLDSPKDGINGVTIFLA